MALILNNLQEQIFSIVSQDPVIQKDFYFSGGTALSECYLHHRESVDLDFFSEKPFERTSVERIVERIRWDGIVTSDIRKIHDRYTFETKNAGSPPCILDFCHYPFPRIKKATKYFMGVEVDSLYDIWINKWCTLFDRNEGKDTLDIVSMVKTANMKVDNDSLAKTALDIRQKFSLSVNPKLMREQFQSRLQTTRAGEMRKLLYIDIGDLDIFS